MAIALAIALGSQVAAQDVAPPVIKPETIGRWRFQDAERPVKAVVIGGSVAAWPRGGFGQFVEAVCPRVEVVNRGKARLGARKLRERFRKQILRNRRIDPAAHESTWVIFMGGLNSVGTPKSTNRSVAAILREAHEHGLGTVALSLTPWGSERDRRWRRAAGLRSQDNTRLAVDYLMGRLTPAEAFGPGRAGDAAFAPGELPDIAVDLYDSELRARDAPLREEERTRGLVARAKPVRAELKALPEDQRPARLEARVAQARALPQWYLRAELRAFDHIHPNMEGHRVIARSACPKLPESWGCRCEAIDALTWDRKAGGLVPAVTPEADNDGPQGP